MSCERRIFTERLPAVAVAYARRTTRLAAWFIQVAFALGGLRVARLLQHEGCPVSRQTLLRQIRSFPIESGPTPQVLSIDDFAFRQGRTYGTIFVDLERHRVVDLLSDRSTPPESKDPASHRVCPIQPSIIWTKGIGMAIQENSIETQRPQRPGIPGGTARWGHVWTFPPTGTKALTTMCGARRKASVLP